MTGHEDPTLDMVATWPELSPLHHWWATVMATNDHVQLERSRPVRQRSPTPRPRSAARSDSMRPALATVSPHRTHRFALPRHRLPPTKSRREVHPPYTPPWEKQQRWDPLDALLAAILATIGFAVTVLLILP